MSGLLEIEAVTSASINSQADGAPFRARYGAHDVASPRDRASRRGRHSRPAFCLTADAFLLPYNRQVGRVRRGLGKRRTTMEARRGVAAGERRKGEKEGGFAC